MQKIKKGIIPPDKEIRGYKRITDTTEGVIKPKIYFAHPFDKMGSKREEMIEKILTERGFIVVNPFKEEYKLNEKYGVKNYYQNPCDDFAKDIVDKDWRMVENCDAYFGWFPKKTTMIGTPIELIWALLLGKEIITLCDKPQPFLKMFSDKMYLSYSNFADDKFIKSKKNTVFQEWIKKWINVQNVDMRNL